METPEGRAEPGLTLTRYWPGRHAFASFGGCFMRGGTCSYALVPLAQWAVGLRFDLRAPVPGGFGISPRYQREQKAPWYDIADGHSQFSEGPAPTA